MKTIIYIILICLPCIVTGQLVYPDRIGYVSNISLFVESCLHLNDEIFYYPKDNLVTIKLPVLSSRVKMGYPVQGTNYSLIHRIDYMVELKKNQLKEIEYNIEGESSSAGRWKKLGMNREKGDSIQYFLDTLLSAGSSLRVNFRQPDGQIFQVVELERKSISPSIRLFRSVPYKDTTKKDWRPEIVKDQKYSEGFSPFTKNHIETAPGHALELVFANPAVNKDSSILYRLHTGDEMGAWERTGHFMLLRHLKRNHIYSVEVKYEGTNNVYSFDIRTRPYWYQTSVAVISFIALAVILVLAISFIRLKLQWNEERRKRERLHDKLRVVQVQLNPHFVFNALSSIQSLVNSDKKQEANKYLSSFSTILRETLKNNETGYISLAEELEFLKKYLEIEQLRFQFSYNLEIDKTLNAGDMEIPAMLFQPTLENAIKHGIRKRGESGEIDIRIKQIANGFVVAISDNGQWIERPPGDGWGIPLTKKRIAAINELEKTRKIQYAVQVTEVGTTACFNFYNWFV